MEREDMTTALHGLFIKGLEINLRTEEFSIIKLRTEEETKCKNFSDWVNIFIDEGNVYLDDVKNFKENLKISYLKEKSEKSMASTIFCYRRRKLDEGFENVAIYYFKSCKWTEENPIIILGVMPLDEFVG